MPRNRYNNNNWLEGWERAIRLRATYWCVLQICLSPHTHQRTCNLQHMLWAQAHRLIGATALFLVLSSTKKKRSLDCSTTTKYNTIITVS